MNYIVLFVLLVLKYKCFKLFVSTFKFILIFLKLSTFKLKKTPIGFVVQMVFKIAEKRLSDNFFKV